MANEEHLAILRQGVEAWNQWRGENRKIMPDLNMADLRGASLSGVDLSGACLMNATLDMAILDGANFSQAYLHGANLSRACLSESCLMDATLDGATLERANLRLAYLHGANLRKAHLRSTDLTGAHLWRANLSGADFSGANLCGAYLSGANLHGAHLMEAVLISADLSGAYLDGTNLSGAHLFKANLQAATLIKTNFAQANLAGCSVYGISAWNVDLVGAQQSDLIITPAGEPVITVDDLEVAQFIYLLLHNEKIRHVIETVTSKAVLILGRFEPPGRKAVLDALREALRRRDRLPIVFDFTGPGSQTTDETISTLAHMARFVIADLTDAKSVLQELRAIVPNSPSVLVQPILLASQEEPGMFDFFRRFPWVLEPYRYHSQEEVLAALDAKIIAPVEARYGR
jgi:uncharacterized protein YjbI with pentapeptide repeats